jgi:hypothetical protein
MSTGASGDSGERLAGTATADRTSRHSPSPARDRALADQVALELGDRRQQRYQ